MFFIVFNSISPSNTLRLPDPTSCIYIQCIKRLFKCHFQTSLDSYPIAQKVAWHPKIEGSNPTVGNNFSYFDFPYVALLAVCLSPYN